MIKVGVIGASGFTGAELLRLLSGHPGFELSFATGDTQAGTSVSDLYPSLSAAYPDLCFVNWETSLAGDADLVFLALPHGASQKIAPALLERDVKVVDLAADFRLRDPGLYPKWYGEEHEAPELLGQFVYGLPELFRSALPGARAVAAAGCYPTAASLALAPFLRSGLVETEGLIVDAASGVSGAGRPPKPHTSFCTVDEDFTAYGLLDHRHTPEIEQSLGAQILLTPHLAPMNRGILATCYARPVGELNTAAAIDVLRSAYGEEPFVAVTEGSPSTKATLGSNTAHVTARVDERTGWLIAIAAIDNLVKGASGQAIQCANVLCGLAETDGLPRVGLYP